MLVISTLIAILDLNSIGIYKLILCEHKWIMKNYVMFVIFIKSSKFDVNDL